MCQMPPVLHWYSESNGYRRSHRAIQQALWQTEHQEVNLFSVVKNSVVKKKASGFRSGAFFIACYFSLSSVSANEICSLSGTQNNSKLETVRWQNVIDGDTIWLVDGRKVRLQFINAPEVAHDNKKAEAFGEKAKQKLARVVSQSRTLIMKVSPEGKDNYGRTLAHLYLQDGSSLQGLLLREGLAYQIFMENSDSVSDCLKEQERFARAHSLGVWSQKPFKESSSDYLTAGFSLIRGKVVEISKPKKSHFIWIELSGSVVLRVPKENVSNVWLQQLKGARIEVRGWMVDRSDLHSLPEKNYKRWMMLVYQSDAIVKI